MFKNFLPVFKANSTCVYRIALIYFLSCFALSAQTDDDPYLWLEDIEGEKQLEWVENHNSKTLDYISNIEGYQNRFDFCYKYLTSSEQLPYPEMHGDFIYNFWQDEENPRGIWRRISYTDYLEMSDKWETLIDIDKLCENENINWTYDKVYFIPENNKICAVQLSKGGSDAGVIREFDLERKKFIEEGFYVGEAKSDFRWIDENTVYLATDFGDGSLTNSGYPRIVKKWRRGTSIEEAETVLEIPKEDLSVGIAVMHTQGKTHELLFHAKDFYNIDAYYILGDEKIKLNLPPNFSLEVFKKQVIVEPLVDWKFGEDVIEKGNVVALNLDSLLNGNYNYRILFEKKDAISVEKIRVTGESVLINSINNIVSELLRFKYENGKWTSEIIDLPTNGLIEIVNADRNKSTFFLTYESPIQSTSLYVDKEDGNSPEKLMSLPDYFDSRNIIVKQNWTKSKDGTRIPYFIMHKRGLKYNGNNPLIQYGYGGFNISETPYYSSSRGKLWLENGGVFVIANIRGGGEYGPDWHLSAMKENKQKSYDDFIAVSEDLINRKITSPENLGIYGGSNGGLLVAAVMVQRPELYKAVACFVPLLDMKRYSHLLAGNSWMAEYGNPDIPEEWEYISKYSPYHNVRAGIEYPKVLFLTSTRDDRVHPGHARKMTARMEEMGHEVYLFENTEGGHAASYIPEQTAQVIAMYFSFFHDQLMK